MNQVKAVSVENFQLYFYVLEQSFGRCVDVQGKLGYLV